MLTLKICLAKFEVIPTNRSRVSFSEPIRVNYYFLASNVTRFDPEGGPTTLQSWYYGHIAVSAGSYGHWRTTIDDLFQ